MSLTLFLLLMSLLIGLLVCFAYAVLRAKSPFLACSTLILITLTSGLFFTMSAREGQTQHWWSLLSLGLFLVIASFYISYHSPKD